ncbi:LacI family transcriptional regulator [Wenxinia saemankumensis]|uniref:Transcriptional regulator, LacI family n=1 Tax=Wenxinia saemankumensis TaxID=1447782 RepID=A0A1M6G8W4_9RHOB|nr:LacI family transcriptional regulator [Wenxinia saemankumensis]SHJ06352.1 transcriptional regulator, LacI family [Wenxinia saemankumensis]
MPEGTRPEALQAKPTLKTISALTGLAVPTVSRALNDAPDIGAETKERVRRIAAEIGYVPNRAGVRLRTGRTNVISLVMSTEHEQMTHTARLISSLAGALRGTPFHLIMTPYFPDEDPMKPIRYIVENRSADALVFNQIKPEDERVAFLLDRGFPFATHGRTIWSDRHGWADYDNAAYGRLAIRALVERGRRNVVLIAPPRDQTYAQAMIEGFLAAAAEAGIRATLLDEASSDEDQDKVGLAVAARLAADPTIDGLASGSTKAAMAAVAGMEAEGFDVGTDVDIVAKEAFPILKAFRSRILVVTENVRETGDFLAQAAIRAIRFPGEPPLHHLEVPTEFA